MGTRIYGTAMPVSYTHLYHGKQLKIHQTLVASKEHGNPGDIIAVSYTHLDVYKRQAKACR